MFRISAPRKTLSSGDLSSIIDRLKANEATIDTICKIAGIAGASIGVIHEGDVIYKHHHGYQHIAAQSPPDDETLYGIGSCSKPFFAAVTATLVSEGKLKWNEPVKKHLPMLEAASEVVTENASLIDLLAHRTGLTGAFHMTFQGNGDHLIHSKDFWHYLQTLQPAASLRERWIYNSHGYSIVGELLTKLTGKPLNALLQEYVSKPLGLTRTITELDFDTEPNFAKPYSALADGSPYELNVRQDFRHHFFEAAAGVYSTLDDMLKFLQANLDAMYQESGGASALKETGTFFSQHIPVLNPSFRERSYALGWIRTQLPGRVGVMGDNIRILGMDKLPVIGEGMESRLALYHQGATVGYFPSVYMFPETRSGIVVLTNSIDQADWIAQSLIQVLFDDSNKVDWLALAEETKNMCLAKYTAMKDEIASKKKPGTSRALEEYVGDYWDASCLFHIRVSRKSDGGEEQNDTLELAFQGLDEQTYDLRHYHDDVFEWTLTRDETAKRARYHMFGLEYFLMEFRGGEGMVEELVWHDDANLCAPRVLEKGV